MIRYYDTFRPYNCCTYLWYCIPVLISKCVPFELRLFMCVGRRFAISLHFYLYLFVNRCTISYVPIDNRLSFVTFVRHFLPYKGRLEVSDGDRYRWKYKGYRCKSLLLWRFGYGFYTD